MGEIISSKVLPNNNVLYRVLLEIDEALALKNGFRNVCLFSPELCKKEARIIERGREKSTKYFEIPFNLRFRKKKAYEKISYQKLENHSKIFYIYVINKNSPLDF
ncbi:hypothetical protein A3K73_05515 [Candidatus Pacearchaeota archaeon RBG_13_36_9]|nr:MAG: hypothetical protein A3K73_05515 [Candidatus Pacearchaeota archaeon RBG_13_36_9]